MFIQSCDGHWAWRGFILITEGALRLLFWPGGSPNPPEGQLKSHHEGGCSDRLLGANGDETWSDPFLPFLPPGVHQPGSPCRSLRVWVPGEGKESSLGAPHPPLPHRAGIDQSSLPIMTVTGSMLISPFVSRAGCACVRVYANKARLGEKLQMETMH